MTVVHAQILRPDASGVLKPARGYLRWTPVGRYSAPGTALVLPLPFRVKLVDGEASATVAPTTADWAWQVTYELRGLFHDTRTYAVPDSAAAVELSALTEVSLSTGAAVPPRPSWQGAIDAAVAEAVGPAVTAALAGAPAAVTVLTGAEARPATTGPVFWIGGTTRPGAMADGDLWFKAAP